MVPVRGLMPGIVHSLEDPRGEGRVQVRFPMLPDITEYPWAPIATAMAGKGRGTYFMPEADDEVLVGFDRGDFQHPYVIGFLWNGVDRPPHDGIDPGVRRLRTVSGHVLDFDDRAGSRSVRLKTQGGQEIELDDQAPSITVRTGDNSIRMDSTGITIETSGILHLKGSTVKIEARGPLTASGNPIHLNP